MTIHVKTTGIPLENGATQIIWAHGWGQSGAAFAPLAQSLNAFATHHLLDLPGFGATPAPNADWHTTDYADALEQWIATLPKGKKIWIGHSFGGRVGLRLAANHPNSIDALVLIGTAGLPRKRSLWQTIHFKTKVYAFKFLKIFVPEGPKRDALRARFGSADYLNAGAMRQILLNTVREDQTDSARNITTPTIIICGANDTEAPPDISQRLHALIPNSSLHILQGYDHYSILTDGRHQVARLIKPLLDA